MVDLVLWSFVIALSPVALGLTWNLVSGLGCLIGVRSASASESRGLSGIPSFGVLCTH